MNRQENTEKMELNMSPIHRSAQECDMLKDNPILIFDDWRGTNIPKDFANDPIYAKYLTDEQTTNLSSIDNEYYWETWDEVLNSVVLVDPQGVRYTLFQDGALWAIPEGFDMDSWR